MIYRCRLKRYLCHNTDLLVMRRLNERRWFVCLSVWFLSVLVNYWAISRTGPKTERLTILRAATHETELGDHDFCLSRSHYTDTDPTSRERAATAEKEPGTFSPGVARSTDWATAPPERRWIVVFLCSSLIALVFSYLLCYGSGVSLWLRWRSSLQWPQCLVEYMYKCEIPATFRAGL